MNTMDRAEVERWRATRTRKRAAHAFMPVANARRSTTTFTWPVCARCGLVLLKNPASQQAARASCDAMDADS